MYIKPASKYWSAHTHSKYSVNDALPTVESIVTRAAQMNQRAVGLTDHGNMAGSVELYTECMKKGLLPFPGSELYFVPNTAQHKQDYKNKEVKASRNHLGVLAFTTTGYTNLVHLSTASHRNHFHKPLVDFEMLAQLHEDGRTDGLAITTGCYFGYAAQTLIKHGERALDGYLKALDTWFPGSVYVEIQNHHIEHDEEWGDERVADGLVEAADRLGLPVVITQDSHYLRPEDRLDHESLKRIVSWGDSPDDAVFPGDGFHLADESWIQDHHHADRLERGLEGLGDLLSRHQLNIEVLDAYAYSIPRVSLDPIQVMEDRCFGELEEMFDQKPPKRYLEQLYEEFSVIDAAGMANYMLLVAMVTDYMRSAHIMFQTRGSAAGSLVCWLLGITNVDPIKWDLRFERFLSKDRTKPPDVDLDIAHDRRAEVLGWLNDHFAAHQIGSWATYSLEVTGEDETDKGSLKERYFTVSRKVGGPTTWGEVPKSDKDTLFSLHQRSLYKGMGTNAAGIVITSNEEEFNKLVPLAYMPRAGAKSGFITQYSKGAIEALGLVKLDVLGSKTLTVMKQALDNLEVDETYLDGLSLTNRQTYQLMCSGSTEGIFQLEGGTTKWGIRNLKPSTIHDVIAAMALFRPAAMNTGGTEAYIKRKHKKEEVPERHPILTKVTATTYGVLLYQEQVIDMLRALGMDADDLNKFLTAVKASNKGIGDAGVVIAGYQQWIQTRTEEMGFNADDRLYLDEAIAGFAEYGFNRAHATVYGITAYRCAYLATAHPLEFHAALLAVAAAGSSKRLPEYIRATRRRGIRVLQPHVNNSGSTYRVDRARKAIRKGLVDVKGIGMITSAVLAEHAPYQNLADLIERTPSKPVTGGKNYDGTPESLEGVLECLYEAGALNGLM